MYPITITRSLVDLYAAAIVPGVDLEKEFLCDFRKEFLKVDPSLDEAYVSGYVMHEWNEALHTRPEFLTVTIEKHQDLSKQFGPEFATGYMWAAFNKHVKHRAESNTPNGLQGKEWQNS